MEDELTLRDILELMREYRAHRVSYKGIEISMDPVQTVTTKDAPVDNRHVAVQEDAGLWGSGGPPRFRRAGE